MDDASTTSVSNKRSRTVASPAVDGDPGDWRIERLELKNFKSYREETIGPFKNFQCVIGPNGAGKSNLMDAISFVLGIRATHLRGSQLKDLIFNPTAKEGSAASKAVAILYLVHSETGDELTFQRSVSAKGATDYKVDGKGVSKEEYNKRLEKLNILVKARNFLVFQGDVEAIASKSPKDFTDLLEQISGSADLIEQYNQLQEDKQQAEDNTIFTFQKKKGMNAERKRYKEQKDEAEAFRQMEQKHADLKLEHVLWQLFHLQEALENGNTKIEEQKLECVSLQSKVEDAEKAAIKGRKEMASAQKGVLVAEKAMRSATVNADQQKAVVAKLNSTITHVTKHRESTQTSLNKLTQDREKQLEDMKALERDLKEVEKAADALEKEDQEALPELKLTASQLKEYHERKEEAGRSTHEPRSKLSSLKRENDLDLEVRQARTATVTELQAVLKQQNEIVENTEARRSKMSDFLAEQESKRNEVAAEWKKVQAANRAAEKRQQQLTEQFDECEVQLREAKSDRREAERAAQEQALLEDLQRLFPGVYGRVIDLCRPTQERFTVAVTVAMGMHMDSIVVQDERTAMQCIQYLKEQRLKAHTFIPVDSVTTKPLNESLRQLGTQTRLALDVLKYDSHLERAIHYVVGNALITDTLKLAQRLAYGPDRHSKVIALDGTAVRSSGLMSGGLASLESKAARWNEKKVATLTKRRDAAVAELADIAQTRRQQADEALLEVQVSGLDTRIKYVNEDLAATNERLRDAQKEVKRVGGELRSVEKQIATLDKAVAARERQMKTLQAEIDSAEDRIFKAFSKSVKVDNIREYEERRVAEAQRRANEEARVAAQRAQLKQQLEFERTRDLAPALERLEKRIEEDDDKLQKARSELKTAEKELKVVEKKLDTATKAHQEAKEQLEQANKDTRSERDAAAQASERLGAAQKVMTQLETEHSQLRNQRHEIFQRCKVEEIKLPMAGARGDSQLAELPTGSQVNSQQMEELLDAEAEVDVDLRGARKRARGEAAAPFGSSGHKRTHQAYLDRLSDLQIEMEKISPNLKAVERYERVVERLEDNDTILDAARSKAKQATDAFNVVRAERTKRFNTAYQAISSQIDPIYKELTRGKNTGAVGTAYLSLENTDEPYLAGVKYNAMPPNKVFRDMEQLSGGEKTVAALALLFAIHSFRPSPFFVLDEVDAALDSVNVSKVANYIRARSKTCQFVVISLKDDFFKKADGLAGVYRDDKSATSHILTLDLQPYDY